MITSKAKTFTGTTLKNRRQIVIGIPIDFMRLNRSEHINFISEEVLSFQNQACKRH